MGTESINPEDIFHKAIEITGATERAAYLDEACKGNEKLQAEVEELLKAHKEAGSFLEVTSVGQNATLDNLPSIEGPGTKIGRYELLEQIGEGGMGLVYLAQQKKPVKRRVALKIIKPGMDSMQVIARFEAERQALAVLDHPNIAHVFDAGTTKEGRPYFIMEYVKGMSITKYCDENKLNIEQRLHLFEQVCEGIHHAHQKGIIHRDLKPSNILVSVHGDRAVPKIIDFGIAKAVAQPLTEKTFVTFQGQLLGTPEYMSPEQVDMATQDIDIRSDIYSLGVVLYELLAGIVPFGRESLQGLGFAEIQRTIREQEPASPSIRLTSLGEKAKTIASSRGTQAIALARRLHRELEWIPLKAMRKDRCRRYRSASELADDVRNYLNGLPLIAGPETAMYRVNKFVHKHAGSVATAAIIAVAIILGLVISTAMYFRAEQARKNELAARTQAEQAREQEAIARTQAEEAEKIAQQQRMLAEERAEDYRRSLYFNRIAMTEVAYRNKDLTGARELLESSDEDLRGWEWHRLNHVSGKALMTINGNQGLVLSVAVSPDGKYIASGGSSKPIKIWNASTGAELMTLRGHNKGVSTISFSPDGRRIVSGGGMDKTVKIWEWATGTELRTLQHVQHEESLFTRVESRLSPDGKYIASSGWDNKIRVWDAETGEELAVLQAGGEVRGAIAFSPNGKQIVSGNMDKVVRVWDWTSGDEPMILRGHKRVVLAVAFSPDGKRVLSGGYDGTIKIWDTEKGDEVMTIDTESYVRQMAVSADGKRIVFVTRDTIEVWDAITGDKVMILGGHVGGVSEAVFSPDGRHVISGGSDGEIKVWDLTDREDLTLRGDKQWVSSMAFSPDGKRIVSGGTDKVVKIYDTISGAEIMTLTGHNEQVFSVAYTNDGSRIISSSYDGIIKIWDAAGGAELATLRNPDGSLFSVSPSPDGKRIVSGSMGKKTTVTLWDVSVTLWDVSAPGSLKTLHSTVKGSSCVSFSSDGKHIVSADEGGEIKIWDADTGTLKRNLGAGFQISCVAFSPDGKQVVVGGNKLKVWNLEAGDEGMVLKGHGDWTEDVTFSPDGRRIIAGCPSLKIWDASTGSEIFSPKQGRCGVTIAVSPDGKTIAALGDEKNIILLESAAPASGYESRRTVQNARKAVQQHYDKLNSYHDVIDALQSDSTLEGTVRQLALQITNARLWEDAEELRKECWEVVRTPNGDIDTYRAVLEKAEKAKDFEPDNWSILNTLGVALYRAGSYDQALIALTDAGKMRADNHLELDHANVAFTAMALYRLDRTEEAQGSIEILRGMFEGKKTRSEKKWLPFLFEAEKLFAGENTKLISAWEHIEKEDYDKARPLLKELRSSTGQENVEIDKQIESAEKWLKSAEPGNPYAQIVTAYEQKLHLSPDSAQALNILAWLRATCPAAEVRDGAKAVKHATRACELTNWKDAQYIDTLAAAYAEIGDFDSAVKQQKKAIDLLTEEEEGPRADMEERLKLYQSGKPYREDAL
jgi:WD40 repeat protein/tRNA A-37 threonylcarbamoyl transferase component Bud32/Flp pilus assembly protein TadD